MRVLLASKALIVGAHHDKLRALGANPDLDLLAVAPDRWVEQGQVQVAERPPPRGYEMVYTPLALNGRYHLFWFRRLRQVLRHFRPDVLHIDEEPYNLATAIACRDAVRYGVRPVFFAWQNLYRATRRRFAGSNATCLRGRTPSWAARTPATSFGARATRAESR